MSEKGDSGWRDFGAFASLLDAYDLRFPMMHAFTSMSISVKKDTGVEEVTEAQFFVI